MRGAAQGRNLNRLPRPPGTDEEGEHHWGEAWRSEVSTFMQYIVITGLFIAKEHFGWSL